MTPHEAIAAKFKQLEAMAADPSLTSAEMRIGILLLRYFNIEYDCAWPSRERLAPTSLPVFLKPLAGEALGF